MMGKRIFGKLLVAGMALAFVAGVSGAAVFAKSQSSQPATRTENTRSQSQSLKKSRKGAVVTLPLRVKEVRFLEVPMGGKTRLAFGVAFNQEIDATTVVENNNIRLLKKNENHTWEDASTQGNVVQMFPTSISWVSGAALETGVYIVHLRGTIKSKSGIYLDCDGDGKGEGGALPAFESKMYNAHVVELTPLDEDMAERVIKFKEIIHDDD